MEDFASQNNFDAYIAEKINKTEWLKYLHETQYDERPEWVKLSQVKR